MELPWYWKPILHSFTICWQKQKHSHDRKPSHFPHFISSPLHTAPISSFDPPRASTTLIFVVVVFQLLSRVQVFATPWTAAHQASLPFTVYWSLLKLMSIGRWCHPTISSSVVPFSSCLQSSPASGSYPMTLLCAPLSNFHCLQKEVLITDIIIQVWFHDIKHCRTFCEEEILLMKQKNALLLQHFL